MSETFDTAKREITRGNFEHVNGCDANEILLPLLKIHSDQQKKIDELEKRLSALDNTGMIGSSPAQFMEKVNELQLKNDAQAKMLRGQQATNKKLAQVTKENELRKELVEDLAREGDVTGRFRCFVADALECEEKIKRGDI